MNHKLINSTYFINAVIYNSSNKLVSQIMIKNPVRRLMIPAIINLVFDLIY